MPTEHDPLREFYEEEARQHLRTSHRDGERAEWRDHFIELMRREGRRSVIDFGAGPGIDGAEFCRAGFRFVGVDLAHGNGQRASERGVVVVQGSVTAPPVRGHSFEAGWSMSTLMHLEAASVEPTIRAMAAVLEPGAPLRVGVWGSDTLGSITSRSGIDGHQRPFHLRTAEENRRLFAAGGTIETEEVIGHLGVDDWNYQLFRLRTRQ